MAKKENLKNTLIVLVIVVLAIAIISYGLDSITGFAGKKGKRINVPAGEARGACRNTEPICNPGLSCINSRCIHAGASGQSCRNRNDPAGMCNSGLTCDSNSFCR